MSIGSRLIMALTLTLPMVWIGCSEAPNKPTGTGTSGAITTPASNEATATAGPLDGIWTVDVKATVSYHGGLGLTKKEKAMFESGKFEFAGGKLIYRMGEKSGTLDYTVDSATEKLVVLKTKDGKPMRFQRRPDGKVILPEHRDWLLAVIEKK